MVYSIRSKEPQLSKKPQHTRNMKNIEDYKDKKASAFVRHNVRQTPLMQAVLRKLVIGAEIEEQSGFPIEERQIIINHVLDFSPLYEYQYEFLAKIASRIPDGTRHLGYLYRHVPAWQIKSGQAYTTVEYLAKLRGVGLGDAKSVQEVDEREIEHEKRSAARDLKYGQGRCWIPETSTYPQSIKVMLITIQSKFQQTPALNWGYQIMKWGKAQKSINVSSVSKTFSHFYHSSQITPGQVRLVNKTVQTQFLKGGLFKCYLIPKEPFPLSVIISDAELDKLKKKYTKLQFVSVVNRIPPKKAWHVMSRVVGACSRGGSREARLMLQIPWKYKKDRLLRKLAHKTAWKGWSSPSHKSVGSQMRKILRARKASRNQKRWLLIVKKTGIGPFRKLLKAYKQSRYGMSILGVQQTSWYGTTQFLADAVTYKKRPYMCSYPRYVYNALTSLLVAKRFKDIVKRACRWSLFRRVSGRRRRSYAAGRLFIAKSHFLDLSYRNKWSYAYLSPKPVKTPPIKSQKYNFRGLDLRRVTRKSINRLRYYKALLVKINNMKLEEFKASPSHVMPLVFQWGRASGQITFNKFFKKKSYFSEAMGLVSLDLYTQYINNLQSSLEILPIGITSVKQRTSRRADIFLRRYFSLLKRYYRTVYARKVAKNIPAASALHWAKEYIWLTNRGQSRVGLWDRFEVVGMHHKPKARTKDEEIPGKSKKILYKAKILFDRLFKWLYWQRNVRYTFSSPTHNAFIKSYLVRNQFIFKKEFKIQFKVKVRKWLLY